MTSDGHSKKTCDIWVKTLSNLISDQSIYHPLQTQAFGNISDIVTGRVRGPEYA